MDKNIRSKQIYAVKTLAIFSVICAHMKLQLVYGNEGWLSDKIVSIFSILGVPTFFICSGYYYHRNQDDASAFWLKKLKMIIIPWFIWAVLTNILNNIIQYHSIAMKGFVKWFSGYSSLYYFLAVLVFCFVIFKPYKNKYYMTVIALISIIANVLVALSLGGVVHCSIFLSYYANYLVWPIFFEIGILWRLYESRLSKLFVETRRIWCIGIIIAFVGIFFTLIITDVQVSYWGYYSFLFELMGFFIILMLGRRLFRFELVEYIGRNTFFIYLTHMQIVGVINTRLPQNSFFYLIKPFIGLAVMIGIVFVLKKVINFFGWIKLAPYIGIKF